MILAFQIISGLGVFAGLSFILAYGWKAQHLWHHTRLGWHLMGMTGSLMLALALIFYNSLWGPVSLWVWLAIIANITALLFQQTWILLTTNRRPEDPEPEPPDRPAPYRRG